jgi:molybdopterin converting factor small subunit
MRVTVRFTGPMRGLAGRKELALALDDGSTLRDLFRALRQSMPGAIDEEVLTPMERGAAPLSLILVNRHQPNGSVGVDTVLEHNDVVAFVPPMAGG